MGLRNQRLAELLIESKVREARESFLDFRQLINKKLKVGWWQVEISDALQDYYYELEDGKRPKLVIQAPPQHGKSLLIIDFIAWIAGKNPELKTIYTSFSNRLGIRANLRLQRIFDSEIYQRIFTETRIGSKGAINSDVLRNQDILEYVGCDGSFRNTTVRGSITGESLDLGIIDDPIRGRADANSLTVRDSTWDWFTDDFFTRFSEEAGLLAILTRWHVDDPIGRLIKTDKTVKVLSYPAIAVQDEKHRKSGEALFPEHKSLEFLLERKGIMPPSNWEALYQQNPYIVGGGLFKSAWFKYYRVLPNVDHMIITVDTAQKTKESNDYSVFALWAKGLDGNAYLVDLLRGKWESPELIKKGKNFWLKHCDNYNIRAMYIEDKVSGTTLIQTLSVERYPIIPVIPVQRNTDKVSRANDVTAFVESGRVYLPEGAEFLNDFTSEHEKFPDSEHDDQVDTTTDALNIIFKQKLTIWDVL